MSEKQYYYFVVQVKDKSEKYYYSKGSGAISSNVQ